MFSKDMTIAGFDDELSTAIRNEARRQEEHIELIASENYASPRVMAAQGSVLTNKYAEGYPGKRYYGGCEYVDVAEQLAIDRLCQLYGAEYANVQPHSGAQANMAVFLTVMEPGDTFCINCPLNATNFNASSREKTSARQAATYSPMLCPIIAWGLIPNPITS